jgi:hypothetical protein
LLNGQPLTVPPITPCSPVLRSSALLKQSANVRMFLPPSIRLKDTRRGSLSTTASHLWAGRGGDHKVPFVFAANGRSYLKQIETESGIWFRDKVQGLIRSFRNDTNPRIAVTVDLLTTGIDVPSITNLVFLRRVTLPSPSARIIGPVSGRHCVLCLSEKRPSPLRPGDGFSLFRHELARQGSNPEPARVMAHTVTAWGGEHHGADRRPIADGITPLRHHHVERASAQTTDKPASGSYLCRRSPQSPAPAWSTAIR